MPATIETMTFFSPRAASTSDQDVTRCRRSGSASKTSDVFSWRFLKRWLHRQQRKADRYSLLKIIDDYYPQLLTDDDRIRNQPSWLLRFGRYLRYHLYRHGLKEWRGRAHHCDCHKK